MPALRRVLGQPRLIARRFLRRHRRPVAAVLVGLGLLLALSSLRTGPVASVGTGSGPEPLPGIRSGEVAVPVVLAASVVTSILDVGDIVDLVGLSDDDTGTAHVVAPHARVVELPLGGSGLTSSASGVVLVAVREADALPVSQAAAQGGVTVVLRSHAPGPVDSRS
jgi:hypothetical protein